MIDLIKIDGQSFDVLVTAIKETFEVIEGSNSGIAMYRQREIRDLEGIKIGHEVTFAPDNDREAFDSLCNYLFGSLREFVTVDIVHGQDAISYEAAYNTGRRSVSYINDDTNTVYYDELTVVFRPMECQITE